MIPTNVYHLRQRIAMRASRRAEADHEAGASTVEVLSWSAMSVVAIVAIGAALQVLGLDIIDYVRTQLGV